MINLFSENPIVVPPPVAKPAIKYTQIKPHTPGGATSCGLTQSACGNYHANYALHTAGGPSVSVPGHFCIACGDIPNGGEEGGSSASRSGVCSFTSDTPVATEQGKEPIGSLKPDEKIWAYNPKTHKMELQLVQHVWINHDDDLIDLTLFTPAHKAHGKQVAASSEVIHTNKKHPFLTTEQGFVPVGELVPGMQMVRADGSVGVVSAWVVVPGTQTMYNLEVAQDHTFTVGDGQWVVHNSGCIDSQVPGDYLTGRAPWQVTPGTQTLEGQYINDLGMVEWWTAHYDQYGRLVGRTDYALGDVTQGIEPTHYHIYGYGSVQGLTPKDLPQGFTATYSDSIDHIPGEYNPYGY